MNVSSHLKHLTSLYKETGLAAFDSHSVGDITKQTLVVCPELFIYSVLRIWQVNNQTLLKCNLAGRLIKVLSK